MAEILMPDMDKPKFCLESTGNEPKMVKVCPFRELCIRKWGGYIGALNVHSEACPLKEVPTHGRLIQAEEVKELLQSGLSLDTYEDQAYVCSLIDEIPTIIEASTK